MMRHIFKVLATLGFFIGICISPAQAAWIPPTTWNEVRSTQYYMGYDLGPGRGWVLGGGYRACMDRYGYISHYGVYKITFVQRYFVGTADIVGFPPRNYTCTLYYNGNGSGHMTAPSRYE